MITPDKDKQTQPEDMLHQDDQFEQTEEQRSQQDIHSNGFDETVEDIGETDESDKARQAYKASEPAFSIDLDDDSDEDED